MMRGGGEHAVGHVGSRFSRLFCGGFCRRSSALLWWDDSGANLGRDTATAGIEVLVWSFFMVDKIFGNRSSTPLPFMTSTLLFGRVLSF